jgi:hypothetical protein
VNHWDLVVEAGQGGSESGCRVTLHDDSGDRLIFEKSRVSGQRAGSDGGQRLAGPDDVEIMIWNDLEELVHLVKHLAMLPRHGHHWL